MNKRILTIFMLVIIVNVMNAQIKTCSWHDGYWGNWISHTTRYHTLPPTYEYDLSGSESGFIIYKKGDHPSKYIFKFQANNYDVPDKKTIKLHYKNNIWYEYSGTVEYYVTESYPTIEAILKAFEFPHFNCDSGYNGNPCVKRTANATIKIAPYHKYAECYNIYFDNVAVGIAFDGVHF